jgi:hypothetical protein
MRDRPLSWRTKGPSSVTWEAAFKEDPNTDTTGLVREVFKLLARVTSPGEIDDVKHLLPPEVRALWPRSVAVSQERTNTRRQVRNESQAEHAQLE